jgi:hypothetical protein
MNTITLPFEWSDARNSPKRYVTSLEGVEVDLLTLTKVDLNKKLDHDGCFIYFKDEQVVKGNSKLSVDEFLKTNPLRIYGVGSYKSHCAIYGFNPHEELLSVSFTDNVSGVNTVKKTTLKTFGYTQEEILNLIESTGVIKRACLDAFIVVSREGFYSWMGEEFMTGELFFEKLKKLLSK